MTFAQFLNAFGPVLEAFDSKKFPQVVLERIHFRVADLSVPEMKELCNLVIDNCEHAPKTSKVAEFANAIRGRFRQGTFSPQVAVIDDCDSCQDLRSIRAIATDGSHEILMLCECTQKSPDATDWLFPVWSREWAPLYRKERCPIEWFKPNLIVSNLDGTTNIHATLYQKQLSWEAKARLAEEFWQHQRKESEPR